MNLNERVIIALDFSELESVKRLINRIPEACFFKIGLELFVSKGPDVIAFLKDKGKKVFLDLKLNDIPNTVIKTLNVIERYKVDITDVHISIGEDALNKIKVLREQGVLTTNIFGITVLTSLDQNQLNKLSISGEPQSVVLQYAGIAAGKLDGVVCSPNEIALVKGIYPELQVIAPGIRLQQPSEDQKRVATPEAAFENGADYIVVGREITRSQNPRLTFDTIVEKIRAGRAKLTNLKYGGDQ